MSNLMITEWNEAWWADRPHDHEIAAAWCADGMIRSIIPKRIDKPCLFYAKQGDSTFRGDFGILMQDNRPKPTYNAARIFNSLRGHWLKLTGGDDDMAAVAALGEQDQRLAIVLVNYRFRFATTRSLQLTVDHLPASFRKGTWKETRVDAAHSNLFNDASHCELEATSSGVLQADVFNHELRLLPNSVVLIELGQLQ
jgi:hypothetical protein